MSESSDLSPLRGQFDQVNKAIAAASRDPLIPREARLALSSLSALLDGIVARIEKLEREVRYGKTFDRSRHLP